MANDEEVGVRLSLKDRKRFSAEADRAAKDIDKIGSAARRANREGKSLGQAFSPISKGLGATAGLGLAAARGVGLFGAGLTAATAGASLFGLKAANAFEQSNIAFEVLLKSQDKARTMVADLQKFAKETPFEFADVQTGAQRLLAMGFAGDEVLKTMRTLGDAASSGIGPPAEMISRLTYAFGQIKATGRVQSDELRQLYEAGIPGIKILAEGFGVTTAEMQKMVTEGIVPADKAIEILLKGIDKNMGGLTVRQSKTLGGMVSNLKDAARFGSAKAFRPVADVLKYYLPGATQLTTRSLERLGVVLQGGAKWWERNRWMVKFYLSAFQSGGLAYVVKVLDTQTQSGGRLNAMWAKAKGVAGDVADVWRNSLWPAIKDLSSALGGKEGLLTPLGASLAILSWMADHPDAAKAIFEGAAIAITSWKLAELIIGVRNAMWGLNAAMAANPITLVIAAALTLMFAFGLLYDKLNEGRPLWEKAIAAVSPFAGLLLTVKNHLDGILTKLGLMKKDDYIKGTGNIGPWASGLGGEGASGGAVGAMASGGITNRGGTFLVGERAPELLTLPRGARVDPLPQDHDLPSFGTQVVVNVSGADVLHAQRVADVVVERIQDKLART